MFRKGETVDLGTLAPGDASWAKAINSEGQVVGTDIPFPLTVATVIRAFFHDGTQMQRIPMAGDSSAWPRALNDNGEVVGWYLTTPNTVSSDDTTAFYYKDGQTIDLSQLVQNLPADERLTDASYISNQGRVLANGKSGAVYLLTPVAQSGISN